jgi:DNA-binding CsgD family transcriptional regulator/tetratricopeptide (TPR) repeat protein
LRAYRPIVDAVLRARRIRPELPLALTQLVDPAPSDADPLHVADALVEWLAYDGTVLVLEDLHWADAGTVDVLEQLADTGGLAVIATARSELPAVRGADVVPLTPVSDLVVHEIASRCLGGALTARLAAAVARGADGLPFLVEELLAALSIDGRLQSTADGWDIVGADPAVPRSIAETVAPRLSRLDDTERRVIAAAAVVGRRFDWAVVAKAADVSEAAAVSALRHCAELQLLDADPDRPAELRFRHALTRDAVDALTFPLDRRQLASRALDVVLGGPAALTGDDLLSAAALARTADRGSDAAPLLLAAAQEAFDRNTFDAAELLLEDAASVSDPADPLHRKALQERLRVLSATGRLQDVHELGPKVLQAIPADDTTSQIEVHLRLSRSATEGRDPEVALQHVADARRLLGPEHVGQCYPARVDFEHANALVAAGELTAAAEVAQRCIAQTFPDDPDRDQDEFADVEAFALIAWAQAVRRDDPARAHQLLDRAESVLAGMPVPLMLARIGIERAALALDAGHSHLPDLAAAERAARLAGSRGVVARALVLRGTAALLTMDDDGVVAAAAAAEQLADRHALPGIRADAALLRACVTALQAGRPEIEASDQPVVTALAELARGHDVDPPVIPYNDVLLPFARVWVGPGSAAAWITHQRARLQSDDRGELTSAAAWFELHGLTGAAEATRDRLRAHGIPFPRRRSALADVPAALQARGVTARELEVLNLVPSGLSNREVADRLVVSVRTVDKHVEHLLAKTGCANRTALASFATPFQEQPATT